MFQTPVLRTDHKFDTSLFITNYTTLEVLQALLFLMVPQAPSIKVNNTVFAIPFLPSQSSPFHYCGLIAFKRRPLFATPSSRSRSFPLGKKRSNSFLTSAPSPGRTALFSRSPLIFVPAGRNCR